MTPVRRRGARHAAAPLATALLVVAVALSGCNASTSPPPAHAVPAVTPLSVAGTATTSSTAVRALTSAARVMRAVTSYRFDVTEHVVARNTQSSRLVGAVVRGEGLTYRLTVGRRTTQVVRLATATYVRPLPHRWSRLRHPARLADPTTSLLQILQAMSPSGVGRSQGFTAVNGTLSVAAARQAGLPASRPADVTVTIDRRGRVVAVDVATVTQAAGRDVTVRLRALYDGFGQVARIRTPV